jgi:YVTN family beta-propeller protein
MPFRIAGLLAVVALAATFAGASIAPATRASAAPTLHTKKCSKGTVRAVIGGKVTCLRAGARCKKRYERAYERHGFRCRKGRLVHRAKPLPPGSHLVASIPLPGGGLPPSPNALVADTTGVWVIDPNNGQLLRFDPATGTVVAQLPRPALSDGLLASGAGAVWETDFDGNSLSRIDPATNQVAATISLGADAAPEGVGYAGGAIWVAEHHQGTVSRVNPATNAVTATVDVAAAGPDGPNEIAAGATGVWVQVPKTGDVAHIDPSTNSVAGRVLAGSPILDGDKVWIERPFGLDLVDPATNKVIKKTALPETTGWGAAGLGSVWIPTKSGLARVDEQTGKLVGLEKGLPTTFMVAVSADSIWLTSPHTGRLLRCVPT